MSTAHTHPSLSPRKRPRDIRLDVFRGLCLIIIFLSHVWQNPWAEIIPARFGFSDATEIFVFCSGMASAIAFGSTFRTHGFMIGAARVLFRCWQVYWAHIGVFLVAAASMIVVDRWLGTDSAYVQGLGILPLLEGQTRQALVGLLTLTWVPNYFDILPMYLVILLLLPVVISLYEINRYAALAFVAVTWAIAGFGILDPPAEPWSTRPWFFNPLSWQLVFFTGFAFMSGWLPTPAVDRRLIGLSAAVLALSVPLSWWPLLDNVEILARARDALGPLLDKSRFGVLRYAHFLALAYLAYVAAGEGGKRLAGPVADILRKLGQQSLAIFMTGLVLSFSASAVLNLTGRGLFAATLVNAAGIAILIGVARITAWFKAQPWQQKRDPRPLPDQATQPARPPAGPKDKMPLNMKPAR